MKAKAPVKAQAKLTSPADLKNAVAKISAQVSEGHISGVQLYGERVKDSFHDSFSDGGTWRDTFVDGGQFLSNFNNLSTTASVQHPAVQVALEKFQRTAKGGQ